MTVAIAKPQSHAVQPFEPSNLGEAMELAKTLATSGLIPKALQSKPADVLVVLMKGHELGVSPMQALAGIDVINGKARVGAELTVGLCLRRSDVCEYFRCVETTAQKAVYVAKRRGSEPVRMEWTIEQAKRAGLLGKENWQKHPEDMLRRRCSQALARDVFPDLTGGLMEHDEAEEIRGPATVAPPKPERVIQSVEAPKPAAASDKPQPEDAQLVEPPPPSDADAPPASAAPISQPTPVEEACDAIAGANTLDELKSLASFIQSLKLNPADAQKAREAYDARRKAVAK